ncbi:uncharacterized protein [Paramormyrops kingsleyae]|uniref:uncharacterized protein n=1 Tax=Paramormyrops kingsleyae TaxID=1676925 RepID=UPI003B975DF9
MGKCKFSENWLHNPNFAPWLRPVSGSVFEVRCILCKKNLKLGTMGVKALETHMQCKKHKVAAETCRKTPGIYQFCSVEPTTVGLPQSAAASQTSATASASTSSTAISAPADIRATFASTTTLRAEVLWCLHTITKHQSYTANEAVGDVFRTMFPDSEIARTFKCGKDKTAYIARFGLAPYITKLLVADVNKEMFVLMFDESLNETSKSKQLDLHVRFWGQDRVQSRYLGSQFMGHGTAQDLLHHFKECALQLDLKNLLSVSMDGPNVNWRFLDLLQQEHHEQFGGTQLIVVGSCGLHTLHNACKRGFSIWHMEKVLRALHILFHNAPARREDFTALTKCTKFPLPFCGHRWLENLPVVERALEVWPSVTMYMDAVRRKKIPNPGTASYDTLEAAEKDPLILAKLHFYMAITRTFSPFLTFYQTDVPVIPFFAKDLAELLKSMLRRFVKKEVLKDISPLQLVRLDVSDNQSWVNPKEVNIGLGAESLLKELQKQKKIGELTVLEFRKDCLKMMSTIIQKVQEKSPLKYPVVRQVACLDPSMMLSDPDWCKSNMTKLVQKFLQAQQLSGGVSAGDVIIQQFSDMLSAENETLVSYRSTETRLDTFLHGVLAERYDELWGFCKKLLLLSHGQATVERGFSINKEVETCNMQEETMVTHRLVCDYVNICGGLLNVPISKELLASAASARSRYRMHLDQQKAKKITDVQAQKRKSLEENIEHLKKKKKILVQVSMSLQRDADQLAEEAEGKAGTLMAQLITKSNTLRKRYKEKTSELQQIETELEAKGKELRSIQ